MEEIGTIVTSGNHTWVIEDYLDTPWNEYTASPEFHYGDELFQLLLLQTDTDVRIWLYMHTNWTVDKTISFSLSLVGHDGTLKEIGANKETTFLRGQSYSPPNVADAKYSKQELSPDFLPNGELRILCSFDLSNYEDSSNDKEEEQEDDEAKPSLAQEIEREVHRFCDFTLECGDQEIPVSRLLLASKSPVFSAMFSGNFQEAKTGRGVIKDVDPKSLEALVKFCHTNNLGEDDLTTDLLVAANKYLISALVEKCEEHLSKTLSVDNATDYFLVACMLESNKLRTAAKKFITENLSRVKETVGFKNLEKEALAELLTYSCQMNQ